MVDIDGAAIRSAGVGLLVGAALRRIQADNPTAAGLLLAQLLDDELTEALAAATDLEAAVRAEMAHRTAQTAQDELARVRPTAGPPRVMCICDPLYGVTCAMHAEQARAAAAGRPMVDETAARAAAWVPLAEVFDTLRDAGAFADWRRRLPGPYEDKPRYPPLDQREHLADYLADRFSARPPDHVQPVSAPTQETS